MATTAVTVEEYLRTSYRPDREYVDGEVLERNLGEKEHSLLQVFMAAWFHNHRREWNIIVLTEQRVQAAKTKFRVPDVSLVRREDDFSRIVTEAPLLCIEILSPEDRMSRTSQSLEDYRRMGVKNIWMLDPEARQAWTYTATGLAPFEGDQLRVADSPIYLPLAELWAELD
jgi:Uma2 family endonuclease